MARIKESNMLNLLPKGFPTRVVTIDGDEYVVPKYITNTTNKIKGESYKVYGWVVKYNSVKYTISVKQGNIISQLDKAIKYLSEVYVGNVTKQRLGRPLRKSGVGLKVNHDIHIPFITGVYISHRIIRGIISYYLGVGGLSSGFKTITLYLGNTNTITQQRVDEGVKRAKEYREKVVRHYKDPFIGKF